ncbi:hypothetical protein HK104_001484 [Borealophlyctis nickersoniae]|nr:hypothetical protein HK104_001484 [Borealophlyctis nickersoniae]
MTTDPKLAQARETMNILHEVSLLLNTGLDRETLSLCVSLCESGVNPEALAAVIKELKRESRAVRQAAAEKQAGGGGGGVGDGRVGVNVGDS